MAVMAEEHDILVDLVQRNHMQKRKSTKMIEIRTQEDGHT